MRDKFDRSERFPCCRSYGTPNVGSRGIPPPEMEKFIEFILPEYHGWARPILR